MKLTKQQLKQIIKEELKKVLKDGHDINGSSGHNYEEWEEEEPEPEWEPT